MVMRHFIHIVENAQEGVVYHGTTKDLWESPADGSLLFLAISRSEAETYAEERASGEYMNKHPDRTDWDGFRDPSVAAIIVEFQMADL